MAGKQSSAGILLHRGGIGGLEVLLVHPGGPFWAKKDLGAWSIPKGEYEPDEDPLACALREFEEVTAWAARGDLDPASVRSNSFETEWPPRSGRRQAFPEIDRAEWFTVDEA